MRRKFISLFLTASLLFQQTGFIYALGELDISGYLGKFSGAVTRDNFRPPHLRYFSYDSLTNNFKVLLDKGTLFPRSQSAEEVGALREEARKLLDYFKIGLSLPNEKFWVNLRPDSPDNIIDKELARTEIGKILLEADLQLKKDTAGLTSPKTPEGKAYWDKLYQKVHELFGTENVTIPTLTRPWIMPDEIIIREAEASAYIYKATLKVMLEQDYLTSSTGKTDYSFSDPRFKELNEYSSWIIRENIIPKLTKEINSSKRYGSLRQVYYSLILARWFKTRYRSQMTDDRGQSAGKANNYLSLIDSGNLSNLTSKQAWDKTTYFNQYKTSFSQGEYNIKEPVYGQAGQSIRSYFSGGFVFPEDVLSTHADKRAIVDSSVKVIPISAGSAIVSDALTGNKNSQLFRGPALEPDDTSISAASTLPPEQKIEEIGDISDDEDRVSSAVTMNDYRDMFRDYDYRYNGTKPFDPHLGYLFGLSWAEMALQKAKEAGISDNYRVVVARDARKIESDLFNNLVKGLMESGLDVINISAAGPNSVTSYSWAVQEFKPLMSIFITASHVSRPKEVMVRGFKVAMRDKSGRLSSLTTKEIKEVSRRKIVELTENPEKINTLVKSERVNKFTPGYINENCVRMNTLIGRIAFQEGSLYDLARNMESAEAVSVLNEWEKRFGASYPLKGMKVVIDAAHTPSGALAAQTFQNLGAEAVLINGDIWEIEGEHKADPSKESNLIELDEAIKKENANFGMSFDLDGDRGAVRFKTEDGRFMTLAPDNLIGVLLPFLIEKLGYDQKITNRKIGVIRDVLGTFGINDKAKILEQKKGLKAEVFQTDAGYVFLKKQRQELLSQGYAVPIYGERSGHCWLDVTGEIENPLAIAVLFAVMVKKEKYKDDAALSLNPAIEAYSENAVPYKQSPRFMMPFHPSLLETLASEQRNDTDWKFNPSKPSENPPQALIALGRDRAIKALSREFVTDKVYNTPFGKLRVKSFNAYQDSLDEGGLFRFADIMFEKPSGEFAGRFVFRASSNDPAFVCSYEAPIAAAESPDFSEDKVMSVAGVVLNWLVMNKYALVSEQSIRKELMLDESKAKKIAADFNLNPVEKHLRDYRDRMLDLKITGGTSLDIKLSAQELTSEIDYLTRMLGIKDYRRIIQIFRTALNPEALVNTLIKETGKTSGEILTVLRSSAFFRPIAANYRWKTSVSEESEFKNKAVEVEVGSGNFKAEGVPEDNAGLALSDYLRTMREAAKDIPFVFRDQMEEFVGRFLRVPHKETAHLDLLDIVDRIEEYLKDINLSKIKYIFTSGIGANEMYSRQLAQVLNQAQGIEAKWIVVNNPAHLEVVPTDAVNENTVIFEMSRSGGTKETLDFFNATKARFKKRIVAANSGKLKEAAAGLSGEADAKVLIIDDTPGDIGGRQMNRKTLMVYAPLFVALAAGLKNTVTAKEYLRLYCSGLWEANKELDYGYGLASPAVGLAEFLLRHRSSGRTKFSVVYDNSLRFTAKELFQLLNEGANKNIAGGTNNNILDSYSLQDDGLKYRRIFQAAGNSQLPIFILEDNGSIGYTGAVNYVKSLRAQGIPCIVIKVKSNRHLSDNLKSIARTSALLQDMVVYFTYITNQDANSNPAVKFVREITAAMFEILQVKKTRESDNIRISFQEVLEKIEQKSSQEVKKAIQAVDGRNAQRQPEVPALREFKNALKDLSAGIGMEEDRLAAVILGAASKSVLQTDIGEAGGSKIQEITEAFQRTRIDSQLGAATPEPKIISLDQQQVLIDAPEMRISLSLPKGVNLKDSSGEGLVEQLAEYIFKMYRQGKDGRKYFSLSFMEGDADNPLIKTISQSIVDNLADLDITNPLLPLPGVAHTGIEAAMSHPENILNIAIISTNAYGGNLGTALIEKGVTVDDATYVYGISNVIRMALGGTPSIIFEIKDKNQLVEIKPLIESAVIKFKEILKQTTSSSLTEVPGNKKDKALGGIDMRPMNIRAQGVSSAASPLSNLTLPKITGLARVNLDEEYAQIQSLIQAGIVPSVERLEEFVAVAYQKADRDKRIHQAASSLADICRLQEENALRTSDELIELMKTLDSGQFSLARNPAS